VCEQIHDQDLFHQSCNHLPTDPVGQTISFNYPI